MISRAMVENSDFSKNAIKVAPVRSNFKSYCIYVDAPQQEAI